MRIYVIAAVYTCFGATVLSQSLGNLSESVTEGCTEASPASTYALSRRSILRANPFRGIAPLQWHLLERLPNIRFDSRRDP